MKKAYKVGLLLTISGMLLSSCGLMTPDSLEGDSFSSYTQRSSGNNQSSGSGAGTSRNSGEAREGNPFDEVKQSPVNAITKTELLNYINDGVDIYNNAIAFEGRQPIEHITRAQLDEVMNEEGGEIIDSFMKHNHIPDELIAKSFAAMRIFLPDLYKHIFRSTRNGEEDPAQYTVRLIREFLDGYNAASKAASDLLRDIDLDYIFRTLMDMDEDGHGVSYIASMSGGRSSYDRGNEATFDLLEEHYPNDPLVAAYREAESVRNSYMAASDDNPDYAQPEEYIAENEVFAAIRILVDVARTADEAGLKGLVDTVKGVFDFFAVVRQQQPTAADYRLMINAAGAACTVLNNLNYSEEDYDAMLDAFFRIAELSALSSLSSGDFINKNNLQKMKDLFKQWRKIISGKTIRTIIHLLSDIAEHTAGADIADAADQDFAAVIAIAEDAYASLSAEEKATLTVIADYSGVNIDRFFQDLKDCKDPDKSDKQLDVMMDFAINFRDAWQKKVQFNSYSYYYKRPDYYVGSRINANDFELLIVDYGAEPVEVEHRELIGYDEGTPIYDTWTETTYPEYAPSSIRITNNPSTSKTGRVAVELQATFDEVPDTTFEFVIRNIGVYPADLSLAMSFSCWADFEYVSSMGETGYIFLDQRDFYNDQGVWINAEYLPCYVFDYSLLDGRIRDRDSGEYVPAAQATLSMYCNYDAKYPYDRSVSKPVDITLGEFLGDEPGYKTLEIDGHKAFYLVIDERDYVF